MGATELVLKSPSVPLFQRGKFFLEFNPSLEKRGRGDFWGSEAGTV
jgi:hypothetical protein